jgi:predicted DNA-binding protein
MENKEIRVNIRISSETKKFFEELSKEVGAPQSALMAVALKEYIDQKKVIKELPSLIKKIEEMEKLIRKEKEEIATTEKNI